MIFSLIIKNLIKKQTKLRMKTISINKTRIINPFLKTTIQARINSIVEIIKFKILINFNPINPKINQFISKEHNSKKQEEIKSNIKSNKKKCISKIILNLITLQINHSQTKALVKKEGLSPFLSSKPIHLGRLNNNLSNKFLSNLFKGKRFFYDLFICFDIFIKSYSLSILNLN